MKKLLIFPYNGNAREAVDCISNNYEFIGFIDDNKDKQGIEENGIEVFSRDIISKYPEIKILAVPGSPSSYLSRQGIINSLKIPENRFVKIIHPKASISSSSKIGFNTLIMAGVVITSKVIIGNHVCILPNTVIHHDGMIEDFCLIGAGVIIAGNSRIHKDCYIGSGTNIINIIEIG